jgi:NitT/TauT family transport system substrate-binding protein
MNIACSARALVTLWCLTCLAPTPGQAQTKVHLGLTRTLIVGATNTAIDKGYFKDAGIDVEVSYLDGSANSVFLLAQNELQVVEGGVSASFFNAVGQNLPVKIAMDNVSTPVGHWIVLRADLADKIRTIADFKGHVLGINAPSSISLYESAKVLQSAGVSLDDVQVKIVPFSQMAIAFQTKAVDAFAMPTPWSTEIPNLGLGVRWIEVDEKIEPKPFDLSVVMFNTEWAANNPQVAQNFFTALLRGARDYCDAYHHGPNRAEVAARIVSAGIARDVASLDTYVWGARSPDGKVNPASLDDIQSWYAAQGVLPKTQAMGRVIDTSFAEHAARELGPYRPTNPDDRLAGCR